MHKELSTEKSILIWLGRKKLTRSQNTTFDDTDDTVFDDVVSLCGSCRNNALQRSPILSLRVKSLSIQERNH